MVVNETGLFRGNEYRTTTETSSHQSKRREHTERRDARLGTPKDVGDREATVTDSANIDFCLVYTQ